VKWSGVLTGALSALAGVVFLWSVALVDPPEPLSRTLATYSAVYPGRIGGAEVERIPCPPLKHLRLYVVCTNACADTWVIAGVRGLWPENLANPGRIPPQPVEESRARIAEAVREDGASLDRDGAREMIGCYLRLEGLLPELVLTPLDVMALEGARGSEDDMRRLAEGLDAPDALSRIEVKEEEDGFLARLFYWDTALPGRPVLEMIFRLEKNGVLRSLDVNESLRGGNASGSSPGTRPF
jgi:hypothetical protein